MRARPPRSHAVLLALLLLPLGGGLAAASLLGPLPARMPVVLGFLAVAGGAWLVAVRVARRVPDSRGVLAVVVLGAVAVQGAYLLREPGVSDDVPRYVWEGGLVGKGASPYAFAPSAPERAEERAAWSGVYARVNHPDVSAAYPPLTQAVCALVTVLCGGPAADDGRPAERGLRLVFAACALGVLGALFVLLRRHGVPLATAVVWGWCPLVALEFGGSGHFDSLGILCVVAAACFVPLGPARPGRAGPAAVLLACGFLVKLLPALLLPFALRAAPRPGRAVAWFAGAILLGFAPLAFLEGGITGVAGGLSEYALRWESFGVLFRWIERPLLGFFDRDESWTDPRRLSRAVVVAAFLLVALREWRLGHEFPRAAAVLFGAFLLLTPTLHPWYLTWLLPWVALRPTAAWCLLVAAAPVLYWPVAGWRREGIWHEPPWLWPAVALPFLILLVVEGIHRHRQARDS